MNNINDFVLSADETHILRNLLVLNRVTAEASLALWIFDRRRL